MLYHLNMNSFYLLVIGYMFAYASADTDYVCCEDAALGCYSTEYPYDHLPIPSCNVNARYELYTVDNPGNKEYVLMDRNTIPAEFDPARRTVFIIHGYLSDHNMGWSKTMRKRFLYEEDINVIIVGWGDGADSWLWNYDKSAANTRVAAKETALVIENLVANGGADPMLLWCVGHSLGAHLCGHVGMLTHVHRVTGLDPAGPEYEDYDIMAGINPTSGDFVDIIHTDGESLIYPYGQMRPLGHMDFYPNGGDTQPGCITYYGEGGKENIDGNLAACSHMRAVHYFTESINNDCFLSCRVCEDEHNIPKDCEQCEGCTIMGYGAEGSGPYGLYTLHTSTGWFWQPYCERC